MSVAFPGERADYRAARERLLQREIELWRAMEAVAAARRELPAWGSGARGLRRRRQDVGGSTPDLRRGAGWKHLRLLSSAGNTYNRDYHGEGRQGGQIPMLNVFDRDGDEIRHFWATELMFAPADPGQHPRHVGTLEPVWNLFDLTRERRPSDWDEQLSYG